MILPDCLNPFQTVLVLVLVFALGALTGAAFVEKSR